ncbi:hypothetical protein D3C71_2039740 [compost metagenome]
MGDFLGPSIDRRCVVLGPVWPPSPAHQIGVQHIALQVEQGDLCRWRDVVPLKRLVAD